MTAVRVGLALLSLATQQVPASHLVTRWAADVTPDHVLPEYPRPDLVRPEWQSLNGFWEYAIRDSAAGQPRRFDGRILVPFPIESRLSGVAHPVRDIQRLWYRRSFRLPSRAAPRPPGTRWLLHFGAVDWEAVVYVNGRRLGTHHGGYDPFTFDITSALRSGADQELVVRVWDPSDRGEQPRGKQVLEPHSIWYTAVTGIWQTVWLEPVPRTYVAGLDLRPDVDAGTVTVGVRVGGGGAAVAGLRARVTVTDGDTPVDTALGDVGRPLTLHVRDAKLWGPGHPFLYGLRVQLLGRGNDSIASYFGMRKIAVARDSAGVARLFLNDHPLFEFGTLDQGWWPDGLYTAPTDAALRSDIETLQRLGMNLIRKHVKVEPARWYYHCDRLGMLVWQDMPSGDNKTAGGRREFDAELRRVVDALRNHPSIVMWVPFNEGWGQHDTERHIAWLKAYDPTRLVDNASGWTDRGVGDVADVHDYPGPGIGAPDAHRARVLGEFGGLGLPLAGHTWQAEKNWGYRRFADRGQLAAAYRDLIYQLRFLEGEGLAAAVYTQTSDVEIEVNGLMTYDREVVKLPAEAAQWNRRLFDPAPVVRVVVPTSESTGQRWRYTSTQPQGTWFAPDYADSSWREGLGGFGTDSTPGAVVRTVWNTPDIWLRRSLDLAVSGGQLVHPHWRIHHDEDAELFVNGALVGRLPGYTAAYVMTPFDSAAVAALRPGANLLAVHVHQTSGGQYIDVGLDEVSEPSMKRPSVTRTPFGHLPDGSAVELFTLSNGHGMQLAAMTYGGIIVSLRVPDRAGRPGDVVLGYDSLGGYLKSSPYFGAIVGRYGNRIARGQFTLAGKTYRLATNNGPNHLHGGVRGFDKVLWSAELFERGDSVGIVFRHTSPDGDEGYPGTLTASVTYTLTAGNEVIVDYQATTDQPTPVNLTQHSYFNLSGGDGGEQDILGHELTIDADAFTPVDSTLIPTGAIAPVAGTPLDFRTPTAIGARIDQPDEQLRDGKGYDHNFVLKRGDVGAWGSGLAHAAQLFEPSSGRVLDIYTTEPGLQFYSGNFLDGSITGKGGRVYRYRSGLCLETQHFPDSPNHPNFPSTILRPGEEYRSRTVWRFSLR
jgi:galactose mutarotase-like enzyme